MILIENRAEVKQMCITEYDEAETMRLFKEEGRIEGRTEGENQLGRLIDILLANKRMEDIQKAAIDKEARGKLYEEFHIIPD